MNSQVDIRHIKVEIILRRKFCAKNRDSKLKSFSLKRYPSRSVPLLLRSLGIEPRYYGPEGPICLCRVEAVVPSFLGPVAATPCPRTIERRAPTAARSKRTCFSRPRHHRIRDRARSLSGRTPRFVSAISANGLLIPRYRRIVDIENGGVTLGNRLIEFASLFRDVSGAESNVRVRMIRR